MSFTRTADERRRRRCQREISAGRVSPRSPPRRARVRRANLGSPRRARGPVVRPAMRGARDRRARSRRPPRRALCGTREGSRDVLSEPQLLFVFGQRKKRRTTVRGSSPKIITAKSDSCRVPRETQKLGTDDDGCGRSRKSAGSRFRAMAEPWSVRRARDAGEAFRPARKAVSEDHDDDASPASRDGRSAERSTRAASAAPAPRLGPIVALVTRRDRVQHVYCKRTNETVPCVAIRLADDTFDGLRVVLWRAHAAADVGAERRERRRPIVGTLHLFASRNVSARAR